MRTSFQKAQMLYLIRKWVAVCLSRAGTSVRKWYTKKYLLPIFQKEAYKETLSKLYFWWWWCCSKELDMGQLSGYPKVIVLWFSTWVRADVWQEKEEVCIGVAQVLGLEFLTSLKHSLPAFWISALKSIGNCLGSGNSKKSPGNNYFPKSWCLLHMYR